MAPEHQIGTYENLIIKTIHTFHSTETYNEYWKTSLYTH